MSSLALALLLIDLEGRVLDGGAHPIAGATVRVAGLVQATTDSEGRYQLSVPHAGTYRISASRLSFARAAVDVPVREEMNPVRVPDLVLPLVDFEVPGLIPHRLQPDRDLRAKAELTLTEGCHLDVESPLADCRASPRHADFAVRRDAAGLLWLEAIGKARFEDGLRFDGKFALRRVPLSGRESGEVLLVLTKAKRFSRLYFLNDQLRIQYSTVLAAR